MEVLVVIVWRPCSTRFAWPGFSGFEKWPVDDLDSAAWRAIADDEPAESSQG